MIIVGGGIAGCSAAYFLSQQSQSVLLFEKDSVAAHASGFAFGVLRLLLGSSCHGLVFLLRDRRRAQHVLLAISLLALLLSLVMAILLRDWLVRLASHVTA